MQFEFGRGGGGSRIIVVTLGSDRHWDGVALKSYFIFSQFPCKIQILQLMKISIPLGTLEAPLSYTNETRLYLDYCLSYWVSGGVLIILTRS